MKSVTCYRQSYTITIPVFLSFNTLGTTNHYTIKEGGTGYSNTGGYGGQDMNYAFQHNLTAHCGKREKKKKKKTQSKPGNTQKASKWPDREEEEKEEQEEEVVQLKVRQELQVNLPVSVSPQHVQTHSWDTDRLTVTVTIPVQLASRLCHLEMLRQSLRDGGEM